MLDKIKEIIEPVIKEENAELVEIIYRRESGRQVLRLLVDKEGGIQLSDCVRLNERIGRVLDETDIIQENYVLEVDSPGIDRPFQAKRDYEKAIGRLVRVTLNERILDKKEYIARLQEVSDVGIKIDVKKKGIIDISFDNIVRARASVLMQTEIITLSYIEDQDPYSNLSVKTTREMTAETQKILVERQLVHPDTPLSEGERIVGMKEVVEKVKEVREREKKKFRVDLGAEIRKAKQDIEKDNINIGDVFTRYMQENLIPLAQKLNGADVELIAGMLLGSLSRTIFYSNLAEAGGLKSTKVEVVLDAFDAFGQIGTLTEDFSLEPLDNEVTVYKDTETGIMISAACPRGLSSEERTLYTAESEVKLSQAIADYYFNMLQKHERAKTTKYFGLAYMVGDAKDENIHRIEKAINVALGEFGISNFPMACPRFYHVAVEGMQTLVEDSILAFLLPSYSFPEGKDKLGSLMITNGLSLNNAMNVYQFGNGVRMMAMGGTPGLIIRYRDKYQLPWVEKRLCQRL